MTTVEQSTDVAVPVHTAYNQWTQFEDFPQFMQGVQQVRQLTPTRTHWVTKIAGVDREFDAEISEQHPDERIAWHSVDGPDQAGVVTFHRLDDTHTRVMLQLRFQPEGFTEQAGDKLGLVRSRVHGDLENFKKFVEQRGRETGAWRGEVPAPAQQGFPQQSSAPPIGDDPGMAAPVSEPGYPYRQPRTTPSPSSGSGGDARTIDPDEFHLRHDGS